MKSLWFFALLFASAGWLSGQDALTTLVPPAGAVEPGAPLYIALVGINSSPGDTAFAAPKLLAGRLIVGERSIAVELHAQEAATVTLRPGAFVRHNYVLSLPAEVSGRVILEVAPLGSSPLRAVIMAQSKAAVGDAAAPAAPPALAPTTAAAASIDRSFWNHFAPHEAIYFLYGAEAPAAKFQLSFKYRLHSFGAADPEHALRTLQFGYTQRSLWDLEADSSPFYDTSYMPSFFFEAFAPASTAKTGRFTWLGLQTGYQHESNGHAPPDSRSLNTLFFRRAMMIGSFEDWHVYVSPKISAYVGGLSDNPDLKDYRGYAEWMIALGRGQGMTLSYTGWSGRKFQHFSTRLDFTVPVQSKLLDFATYFTVQYFNGYGESLRTYNQRTESVRAGFSLVRLR